MVCAYLVIGSSVMMGTIQWAAEVPQVDNVLHAVCATLRSTDLAVQEIAQVPVWHVQRASMQRERDTGQAALLAVL